MTGISKTSVFGLLIGLLGVLLSFFQEFHTLEEDVGLQVLFKLRGVRKPPSDVIVVSIDRESADRLKISEKPDQWPRTVHAELVNNLSRAGAAVIVFDVYFADAHSPVEDAALADALRNSGKVILAERLRRKDSPDPYRLDEFSGTDVVIQAKKPIADLAESAMATAPFVVPRLPVKVSRYWAFQELAGDAPTSPVVAFQLYNLAVYRQFVASLEELIPNQSRKLPPDPLAAIKSAGAARLMRDVRVIFETDPSLSGRLLNRIERFSASAGNPVSKPLLRSLVELYGGKNQRYLNFYGPPRTIKTIPYYQALELAKHRGSDFAGKAVFIGLSEKFTSEAVDSFYTVFSFISGVEIAATAFANLLENKSLHPISQSEQILLIFMWGILIGSICRIASTSVAIAAVLLIGSGYLLVVGYEFGAANLWYPVMIPLFIQAPFGLASSILWNYFETNRERQNVRRALRHYVPDEVVDQVVRNKVDLRKSGRMEYGVCLFSDVEDYTKLSERMDPGELSDFMHRYFEATFAPLKQNGGVVVDLEGDSILAVWKGSRPEMMLRKQACFAALGLAAAVREFRQTVGRPDLAARIGVHAGQMYLGNIGAGDHYKYGPTGDTVNTASRMEGLNKFLGTGILVSAEVLQGINQFLVR
ncbi:MAG TPA: adenylate/guanylate cyclase domain-containing protein, partial [Candidatus Binatia bacterium]